MPVQQPIPIWIGAQSPAAYRRVGELANGWFPQLQPGPQLDEAIQAVRAAAEAAGRDPASLGMNGRTRLSQGIDATVDRIRQWRALGATHLSIDTMRLVATGPVGIDRHLSALAELAEAIDLPRPAVS
jgi:alkanesulfonate monooxygenase SsuD/methylene tetrahydromethanopterin reductase-like flavin-dependent oxidoreductase (luciferase family)